MSTMWNVVAYDNYASITIQEGFVGPPGANGTSAFPLWVISIPNPVPGTTIRLLLSAPKAFVIDSITKVTATGSLSFCALETNGGTALFTANTNQQTLNASLAVAVGDAVTLGVGSGTATGLSIQIQGHYT